MGTKDRQMEAGKDRKKRKTFAKNGMDKRSNKGHRRLHRTTYRDTGPESTASKAK